MKFNKQEWSYIFYDWAESAFTVIVAVFIFPILFKVLAEEGGVKEAVASNTYSFLVAAISLAVAVLSPILGALADYRGLKKTFFLFFFVVGIVFTILLAFYPYYTQSGWWLILIPFALGTIGFAGTNIFYDAFIVDVTTNERMDRVSTTAYAFGYIGGSTIPLVAAIVFLNVLPNVNESFSVTLGFQLTFAFTAVWWLLFSIPFLRNVHQVFGIEREPRPVARSLTRLLQTFREAQRYRKVFLFLIAYFLFIDGVHTIINLATVFAIDAVESITADNATEVLLPLFLVIQIAAFGFALVFAWLSKRYTTESLLYVTISIYTGISIFAVFVSEVWHFWVLGLGVATAQGAIQALSRSYFGKIVPKHKANEFFGLFTVFNRFAAFIGPLLVAAVGSAVLALWPDITGGVMRYGVLSLVILFILGAILFRKASQLPVD